MFNVRPEALSPWLYVEPPPVDEVPGFRLNPHGSVRDTRRGAPFGLSGFDPNASPMPSIGAAFPNAMRPAAGSAYPDSLLTGGPVAFAPPPRNPLQDALDEIAKIYTGFGPRPSGPFDRQGLGTGMPAVGQPPSTYVVPQGTKPTAPFNPTPQVESDHLPTPERPSDPLRGGFGRRFTLPTALEESREPSRQDNLTPWLQIGTQYPDANASVPTSTDNTVGAPQLGSNQADDPNIVRVGNADAAEADGDTQVAQAEQGNRGTEPRGKVEDPLDALGHYVWGSGKTVEYPFKQIDTSDVKPSQFSAVENILRRGQPGTYKIEGKMPFSTRNLNARYLVGNITLNINGTLVLDEEGKYFFKGELAAEPDRYRFYSSDHRDADAEIATRLGKLLPGREFTVVISGRNPISEDGRYR